MIESGKLLPIALKFDDLVLFANWSGAEVKIHDDGFLIMKESDEFDFLGRHFSKLTLTSWARSIER